MISFSSFDFNNGVGETCCCVQGFYMCAPTQNESAVHP